MDPVRETPFIKIGRVFRVLRKTGILSSLSPRGVLAVIHQAVLQTGPGAFHYIAALSYPEKTAVIEGKRRLTYKEINRRINILGNGLLSLGVRPGDRVAVMLKNSIEYIECTYALARISASAVPVNPLYKEKELSYILENSGARGIFFGDDAKDVVSKAAHILSASLMQIYIGGNSSSFPGNVISYDTLMASGQDSFPKAKREKEGVFTLLYTSGTTGKPKGAPRSRENSTTGAFASIMEALPLHHNDIHLILGPLFHAAPLAFTHFNSAIGSTIVLMDRFDPEQVLRIMSEKKVTTVFMVPTMLHRILGLSGRILKAYRFPSLKGIIVAAAPFSTQLKRRALEYFGDVICEFYGASEIGINTFATPSDLRERPASVGRVLPAQEIAIMDNEGNRLPPGEVGELFVRNEQTIAGYFHNDEATKKSRRGEFFSVGDLASMDEDGYVYLAGRKVDMVISGGINIYPAEIEEALLEHPKIGEAAVIGIPDEEWGEAIMAFIVPKDRGLTQKEVLEFCHTRLAPHKKPKQVRIIEDLPRTPTGKILKTTLRTLV